MAGGIGSDGIVEVFLPPGGTAGQALVKIDTQNYNATWGAGGGGGGIGTISAGTTNATGPGISFSNGSGVTFGMNGNTITASVAAAGGAQTGISGVIVSNTTYTSGTISFSNANGISFGSSAGQAITASYTVPTQTNQTLGIYGSSQTTGQSSSSTHDARSLSIVGAGNISVGWSNSSLLVSGTQTVQTQASGNIAGSGVTTAGNNIGLSGTLNSNGLSLSATVPSQTNQSAGIYASSQTFGQSSSSTHDARSLTVVGSGAVSVGWSNSSLLFSVPVQSVQTQASGAIAGSGVTTAGNNIGLSGTLNSAGLSISATVAAPVAQTNQSLGIYASSQTFGQSSSSTYDARSLSVVGSGGISVGWSNSSLLISGTTYPAQSNQSAIKGLGASNTGNTAGNTGVSSGIDWVIAGSNNITISESTVGGGPNTLWVSGPSVGGAQTGISGIIVSDATYTSGTVSFSNAGNITISSSVNGATQYIRLSGNAAQTNQSAIKAFGASNTGNTAGNTGVSTGIDWVIAGTNNITVSESTVGGGPNTLWLSGPTGGASPALSANNGSFSFQTASFSNVNNVSFVTAAGSAIQGSFALNVSATGGTSNALSGLTFKDSQGVSFGLSTGAGVGTITASVAAQSNQTGGIYFTAQTTGQSSSSTYDLRTLSVVGDGIISAGWSNGTVRISATQSVQTQASGAIAGTGFTSAGNNIGLSGTLNTGGLSLSATVAAQTNQTGGIYITAQSTGQSSSSTYDLRTLSMVGDGIVSIGWSNSTLRVSATQSNQAFSAAGGSSAFQTLGFSDNAAVSFTNTNGSVGVASVRASLYATSNTTQSSTGTANLNSLIFAGAGIASVGVSNGSVVISVPSGGGAGDGGVFAGVSTAGNTAGSTGTVSTGNFVLVGTGALTLSQSTGAAGSAATITFSVPQTSSIVGINGVSVSTNGSTISLSGVPTYTALTYQNRQLGASSHTSGNNSLWIAPFRLAAPVNASTIMQILTINGTASSNQTNTFGGTLQMALWQQTATNPASSNRLDTIWSNSYGVTVWNSGTVSVSYSIDGGASGQQTSSSSGGSNISSQYLGNRQFTFSMGSTINPGLYAYGFVLSTSSAGASTLIRSFNAVVDNPMPIGGGIGFGTATNASIGYADAGTYATTTNAIPASIDFSQIKQVSNIVPFFKMGAL